MFKLATALVVSFLCIGACGSGPSHWHVSERPDPEPRVMNAEFSLEDVDEDWNGLGEDARPWADLDWEVADEGVLVRLAGPDEEQRQARSTFLGLMLLRRTQGLGALEVESKDIAGEDRTEVHLSGEEVALLAARRLLQGLKDSRDALKWEFRLVKAEAAEVLLGPIGLMALAGQKASVSVLDEVAYVKDFDVEISSSAMIADPVIDVLNEGISIEMISFVDPDGRVEATFKLHAAALKRPIAVQETSIGGGENVSIQLPELVTADRRLQVEVPAGQSRFGIGPIQIPITNADGEVEMIPVHLKGQVVRR